MGRGSYPTAAPTANHQLLTGGAQPDHAPAIRRRGQAMANSALPFARPRAGTQPPYLYPDYASTVKRAPRRPPIRYEHTLSEITGPVFAGGWAGPDNCDLT